MHNLMQYNVHLYRININCISKCFIYPSHANYMEYNKESVFILSNKLYSNSGKYFKSNSSKNL